MLFVTLLLLSCADVSNTRYKDTRHLEQPPTMEIKVKPKTEVEENEEISDTGLGSRVSFSESAEKPVIKIKKLFYRSWNIVTQALKLNDIEVKDKNRELGVFYILFDPDEFSDENNGIMSKLTFFFFEDDYDKAAYKLTVAWQDNVTEVRAELADQTVSDLLDDDEDNIASNVDGSGILLKALYKTIKDDLPIN